MKVKKIMSLLLSLILAFALFACSKDQGGSGTETPPTEVAVRFENEQNNKLSYTYSGTKQKPKVDTGTHEVACVISYFVNNAWVSEEPTPAGNYKIKAEVNQTGYTGSREIDFIIAKKQLTLSANPVTLTVGAEIKTPTYKIKEVEDGEVLDSIKVDLAYITEGSQTALSEKPSTSVPGDFTVQFKVNENNYEGECLTTLTIQPDTNDLKFSSNKFTFDNTPKTVEITNLANYYSVKKITYQGIGGTTYQSETAPVNAGSYKATFTLLINNKKEAEVSTTFTIEKRRLELIASSLSFDLDDVIKHQVLANGDDNLTKEELLDMLTVAYSDLNDNLSEESAVSPAITQPDAYGEYLVTFDLKDTVANYYIESPVTTVYTLKQEPLYLTNLNQIYGNKQEINLNTDKYELLSLTFKDAAGDILEEQPENAGQDYLVIAEIEIEEGSTVTITGTFTIAPKLVQVTAQDIEFLCGSVITHNLNYDGTDANLDCSIFYTDAEQQKSSVPPAKPGVYDVEFVISDPNYTGSGKASYTLRARAGMIALYNKETVFSGNPVTVTPVHEDTQQPVTADGIRLDQKLTYEGIGDTVYAKTEQPPVNAGKYKAEFSCVTDGVLETISCTITISKIVISRERTELHDMLYESLEEGVYNQGKPYDEHNSKSFEDLNLPAGESITYSFAADSEMQKIWPLADGELPSMPGEYTYTVITTPNLQAAMPTGDIAIKFEGAETAVQFGKYYFENVAADFETNYWAIAINSMAEQSVNTRRYKTSDTSEDKAGFYYRTTNTAEKTTIDTRFSVETIVKGDDVYWHKHSKTSDVSSGKSVCHNEISTDNLNNLYQYYCPVQSYAAFTQTDKAGYQSTYGTWIKDLSVYDLSSTNYDTSSISELDNKNQYTAKVKLKNPGNAYKTQVKAFSGYPYNSLTSLNITFTIDIYGRVNSLYIEDNYKVTAVIIPISVSLKSYEVISYDCAPKQIEKDGNKVKINGEYTTPN